jgi:hypothetical protein
MHHPEIYGQNVALYDGKQHIAIARFAEGLEVQDSGFVNTLKSGLHYYKEPKQKFQTSDMVSVVKGSRKRVALNLERVLVMESCSLLCS